MKKSLFITSTLALVLAACASSGPTISSDARTAPGVKFKDFETYNFIQPLGTDWSDSRSSMSSMLMNSMMRELSDLGLRRSDESPDILVDFIVVAEDMPDISETPEASTIRHAHWKQGYSIWPGYQTTARQYSRGTLIVYLVDSANSTLVAEGSAEISVQGRQFSQSECDQFIHKIVKDIW